MVYLSGKAGFDHSSRFCNGLFSITLYLGLDKAKVGPLLVNLDGAFSHSFLGTPQNRQRFIGYFDSLCSGNGLLFGLGSNNRNGISQTLDLVFAEYWLVREDDYNSVGALDVVRSYDADNTWHLLSL
ncbi:MAG: hypothetical protein A4E59_01639 [Syntrophorhabdus sp. PtaB.Bin027]|nr:MAG: hypothetical protein A4E59_01639 [Syntrophorhabdus sp. PtaB.Bin027]